MRRLPKAVKFTVDMIDCQAVDLNLGRLFYSVEHTV